TYILYEVYKEGGKRIRDHCRAQPPRDLKPAGLVGAVGGRDRASTSHVAADGIQTPSSTARRRFRRIDSGCPAPPLSAETGAISGVRGVAGSVPPLLVGARRRARTPP